MHDISQKIAVTIHVQNELAQEFEMQARAHGITVDQLLSNGGLIAAQAYRLLALCRGDWIKIGWEMTRRNGYHLLARCASKQEKARFDLISRNHRKTNTQSPGRVFELRESIPSEQAREMARKQSHFESRESIQLNDGFAFRWW